MEPSKPHEVTLVSSGLNFTLQIFNKAKIKKNQNIKISKNQKTFNEKCYQEICPVCAGQP
jgi:hypothetical protein